MSRTGPNTHAARTDAHHETPTGGVRYQPQDPCRSRPFRRLARRGLGSPHSRTFLDGFHSSWMKNPERT